ncbi:hypothetical protein FACS189472_17330 [Alphaproteobacteria bacterium]|nr:hypothetical protein FACS189472_17330 [Alphaproteobacteria bacterium]
MRNTHTLTCKHTHSSGLPRGSRTARWRGPAHPAQKAKAKGRQKGKKTKGRWTEKSNQKM